MTLLVILLAALGVVVAGETPPSEPVFGLADVNDFTYQLQGKKGGELDLGVIAQSAFDLCIIDFSRDGTDEFTPSEISALRSVEEPNRIRLAYMSIGEAEDYRWYYDAIDPNLVAAANPDWKGNFKVRFWEDEWKEVVITGNGAIGKSYLDRIIDQGFDGVYLDIVDAFEFFGPSEEGGEDVKRDAAREMVEFIEEIAFHARVTRGITNFLVVPQNGSNIIEPEWYPVDTLGMSDPATPEAMAASMQMRLFAAVDAIGVEDVFFRGKKKQNNALKPDLYRLGILETWRAADLPVFSVEYLTKKKKQGKLYESLAPSEGFVPYATIRPLSKMKVVKGFEPD